MKRFILSQVFAVLAALTGTVLSQASLAADPVPFGAVTGRFVLTFSDEFNGTSLDRRKWNDHIWYEPSNPTINYAVEGGSLKIWPQRDASGNFFYRDIDTDGRFSQRYGYFEVEARLPYGKGPWAGFWLFNHIGNRRPEIDIFEVYPGGGPDSGWSDGNLHPTAYGMTVWRTPTSPIAEKTIVTPDLSAGFHKYGVKWEPGKISFYFDGQRVFVANASINDPLYIILSLWFGSASGQPDSTTPTRPDSPFEINYVRAWRIR
ncbi:MAG: glycoside hydrolase family 16 protein [Burkholderia sp.]|jgi:beta-glucanase (GH16 family)|nr:glycoside hydrolase family 16 protein [Burkholderia sp.]